MSMMNTSQFFGKKDGWDEQAAFLEIWEREFSSFPDSIPGKPGFIAFGTEITKLETELMVDPEKLIWQYFPLRVNYCSEQVSYLLQTLSLKENISWTISELRHLTLDFEQRAKLKIPKYADMFCWANPIQQEASLLDEKLFFANLEMHDFDVQFLLFGGFMYFKKNELIRCNCIVPSEKTGLIFGPSNSFSKKRHPEFLDKLQKSNRLSRITIGDLRKSGASKFCWVLPGELKGCPHGGFLYLFENNPEKDRYFGLVGTTVNEDAFRRNWEEAVEEKRALEGYQDLKKMLKLAVKEGYQYQDLQKILYSGIETVEEKRALDKDLKMILDMEHAENSGTEEEKHCRNEEFFPESLPAFSESLLGLENHGSSEAKPLFQTESLEVDLQRKTWKDVVYKCNGTISQIHPVTMNAKQRNPVNIPIEASSFCRANPAESLNERKPTENSPEYKFFCFGGFMYFNNDDKLIACNFIEPDPLPGFPESLPGLDKCVTFEAKPSLLTESLEVDLERKTWKDKVYKWTGSISRVHPVTINAKQRVPVNIPSEAHFFCWANPAENFSETENSEFKFSPEVRAAYNFFSIGGFLYFNKELKLVACNFIEPGNGPGFLFGPPNLFHSNGHKNLFHSNVHTKFRDELEADRQLNKITIPHLQKAGATHFCWLLPGELKGCSLGGFLYIFNDESKNRYFSLMAVGDSEDCKAYWETEIDEINAVNDFRREFKIIITLAETLATESKPLLKKIFLSAAKTGQMSLITKFIEDSNTSNGIDDDIKADALMEAASKGHKEICGVLLANCSNKKNLLQKKKVICEDLPNKISGRRDISKTALQCATETGAWDTCLLLYKNAHPDGAQILSELLPEGKKKLFHHSAFEYVNSNLWQEIYGILLQNGRDVLLAEGSHHSNDSINKQWFFETSISLLQNNKNLVISLLQTNKNLKQLNETEMTNLLKWEVQVGGHNNKPQGEGHYKKHLQACQLLIEKGANFGEVLKDILAQDKTELPGRESELPGRESEVIPEQADKLERAGKESEAILERVEYLMEALSQSFVCVDLDTAFVQNLFKLFEDQDVPQFLKKAPYTALNLFLSDSFSKKEYETNKVQAKLFKISKLIHTKVVKLCDESLKPFFFLIKVAAAYAKRGEERSIHQGEYLLLRDHFVEIARDAMKIDEFANIDNTFQALGGDRDELLSFLKEETPISYAMRYSLDEIICSPHVQELLEQIWGIPRLLDALSPFEFEWPKSISTHLNLQDCWSFETYRKIPCMRALVAAFLKFAFLGMCYATLFSKDLSLQRSRSFVFMLVCIGYSVEQIYQHKVSGKKRKIILLILISIWTWMIWTDNPSSKYCNIVLAVTCAAIALFSLEFLNYLETFGFMMVAFSEIWHDFQIFAIFYFFLLCSFGVLFTFTDMDIAEFKDLRTALMTLVSGSFGNFDLSIFDTESSNLLNADLHLFGQVVFVIYLFVVYVILLNLLTALLTVTFTRNQDKKTEKFFLLKASFVRNFSPLLDNPLLGEKLLPAPLCIFNLLFFHKNSCGQLHDPLLFLFDVGLTTIVVIPWCWLLVFFTLLNQWGECSNKLKLKLRSIFNLCHKLSFTQKGLVQFIYLCTVVMSPLWFPCLVFKEVYQNDSRLEWVRARVEWIRKRKGSCFEYSGNNYCHKLDDTDGKTQNDSQPDNKTQTDAKDNDSQQKNRTQTKSNDDDSKKWNPALREKMKGLLEIFKTKTEKGEGLYWISKEVNRDGLLKDIVANNDKILHEQARMLEEMKDKLDRRLGNVESQLETRLAKVESQLFQLLEAKGVPVSVSEEK